MEVSETRLARRLERLAIHERDHQDLARRRILHDRGQQPGGVEPGKERTPLFLRGNIVGRVGNRSDPFDL